METLTVCIDMDRDIVYKALDYGKNSGKSIHQIVNEALKKYLSDK